MKLPLFLILAFSISVIAYETPTSDVKATDMVDKQLPKLDQKIWKNMLQWYGNIRMIAQTTLDDMNAIAGFAGAAQRQLQAIETASKRIEKICKDVSEFRYDNPEDLIIFAEEKFFQPVDILRTEDLDQINAANAELRNKRQLIQDMAVDQTGVIADASVKTYEWCGNTYKKIADFMTTKENNSRGRDKFSAIAANTAAQGIIGADVKQQQGQTQGAKLAAMVAATGGQNGEVSAKQNAEMNKDNSRNNLLLTIQENDLLHSSINTTTMVLLSKISAVEKNVIEKSFMVDAANAMAQAIERQERIAKGEGK